jgi:hypothetical protein
MKVLNTLLAVYTAALAQTLANEPTITVEDFEEPNISASTALADFRFTLGPQSLDLGPNRSPEVVAMVKRVKGSVGMAKRIRLWNGLFKESLSTVAPCRTKVRKRSVADNQRPV